MHALNIKSLAAVVILLATIAVAIPKDHHQQQQQQQQQQQHHQHSASIEDANPMDMDMDKDIEPRFDGHGRDEVHPYPNIKRDVFGFYECSKPNFKGTCSWTQIDGSASHCYNRKYGPKGSFGPDKGVSCTIYSNANCEEKGERIYNYVYPGVKDCPTELDYGGLKNCPSSYRCVFGWPSPGPGQKTDVIEIVGAL